VHNFTLFYFSVIVRYNNVLFIAEFVETKVFWCIADSASQYNLCN